MASRRKRSSEAERPAKAFSAVNAEVVEAAQLGDGTTRVLVQFGDEAGEHFRSVVYQLDGLDPASAREIFAFDDLGLGLLVASARETFVLEVGGIVHRSDGADWTTTYFDADAAVGLCGIGERVFLYGRGGLIWQHDGGWTKSEVSDPRRVLAMHAAHDRVYAAGDGVVFVLEEDRWQKVPVKFTGRVRAILAASDGALYVVGDGGLCFRWARGERVDVETSADGFTGLCELAGVRYAASDEAIHRFDGDALTPFAELDGVTRLTASGARMFAASGDELHAFDGAAWRTLRLVHGEHGWGFRD